ncbi:MAG: ATP-binding protein, partial [Anaerolineae bacterium]|nr:ATP-binding protein [Anaerolineae bacterium]
MPVPVVEEAAAPDMLASLREELLGLLPLPSVLVTYFVLLWFDLIFGIRGPLALVVGACVIASSLLAQRLRARRPRAAAVTYVTGPAVASAVLILVTYAPLAVALLPAVILVSMALLGPRAMVAVAASGVGVTVVAAWRHGQLDGTVLAPVSVVALSAFAAWLSHRNLGIAIDWAWNSYQHARASTREARERRGELARTLKALDEAYGRLERFSAQLVHAREAAEEARRAKQQFVATVSHELRTPLNIIIGFAELMTLSPESYGVRGVPRQFLGDVNRIYRSAQHLKSLIDDVLDLSQIDARHMVLLTEETSPGEVIAEAADMLWGLASQKGLQLVVDVPGDLPSLSMDRLRIRQVLLNLLSNAVRFTDSGQITVTARRTAREVEITVADTGPGIEPADLERVFEEFHQLDSALSRRHQGTGLGLALSRRFVELHGGRMWAESEPGRGSRFHFTLPLVQAPQGSGEGRPLPIPPGVQARAGRVVLLAGEEPMVTNLLRRHLQGYLVQPVEERDLAGAVEALMPHAVIANSLLPASTAGESPLSSLPEGSCLPVPVITCPLPDPALLGRRLGVDHYVTKPVTRERLLELLAGYGPAVRRVLIVDDDAQLAELIARIVRGAPGGYEAEVACGGEEGWARIREWRPDLVLLDLVMEGLDGLGVLQMLRADEQLRATHVIAVTAHDLPAE